MITIWKLKLAFEVEQTVRVPKRHKLLPKAYWHEPDELWVWVEVYLDDSPGHNELRNPDLIEYVDKDFYVFGTYHMVFPGTKYLGTVTNKAETNTWHIYTKVE